MYLFFDTETTGLPKNWKAPLEDLDNWPRLVQLAYIYCDKDGNKLANGDYIIKPEGFTIPIEASNVHGITTEIANNKGQNLEQVLEDFNQFVVESHYLVAHNMAFDEKIMGAEFLRKDIENNIIYRKKICTMLASRNFCAIEGPYGYKWPKLAELYYKLFQTNFDNAHDASADISATAKCFWELRKKGII
ncbi:MAG TPA: 3'-5' exonuclease [Chitinophagales bacterium]|nr:3'-5' exonuclease [Chitinophagales bacterium]HMZ69681.1 3'-5' exonuclease [Chitinophagales bacterium]HMZ93953.1 3'-5' exonuclease [Chitinophagales bacterium]